MALATFSLELKETTLVVAGYIDERAQYPGVVDIEFVNMSSVTGFSSLGLRQFFAFLDAQQTDSVRLLECPVCFIEAVNALSGLLRGGTIKIDSLLMPCRCDNCSMQFEVLIHREDIAYDQHDVVVPPQYCHRCREVLTALVDPWDYFLFLFY